MEWRKSFLHSKCRRNVGVMFILHVGVPLITAKFTMFKRNKINEAVFIVHVVVSQIGPHMVVTARFVRSFSRQ